MSSSAGNVSRVTASQGDIRRAYGTLSRFYAIIESVFEKKLRQRGLALLSVSPGEIVLEIGVGTGYALQEIAEAVGTGGRAVGLDITPGMLKRTGKRLERAGLKNRVELCEGDARALPLRDGMFDAVYMASTLELFDNPEIPRVIRQIKNVLKPNGRFCVGSLNRQGRECSFMPRIYEMLHRLFPAYVSCRPIYVETSVEEAGFTIEHNEEFVLYGLSRKVVVARTLKK